MSLFDAIVVWLHILAAAVFIGPQVFLVFVAMPALRSIADVQVRQAALRRITRGFGFLGGVALAVLLATGIWNYYDVDDKGYLDYDRYALVLQTKLLLVTIVIVLTGLHAMYFGRRLQRLQESNAPEAEIARARQWSIATSMLNLAASVLILLCAALLNSTWAFE